MDSGFVGFLRSESDPQRWVSTNNKQEVLSLPPEEAILAANMADAKPLFDDVFGMDLEWRHRFDDKLTNWTWRSWDCTLEDGTWGRVREVVGLPYLCIDFVKDHNITEDWEALYEQGPFCETKYSLARAKEEFAPAEGFKITILDLDVSVGVESDRLTRALLIDWSQARADKYVERVRSNSLPPGRPDALFKHELVTFVQQLFSGFCKQAGCDNYSYSSGGHWGSRWSEYPSCRTVAAAVPHVAEVVRMHQQLCGRFAYRTTEEYKRFITRVQQTRDATFKKYQGYPQFIAWLKKELNSRTVRRMIKHGTRPKATWRGENCPFQEATEKKNVETTKRKTKVPRGDGGLPPVAPSLQHHEQLESKHGVLAVYQSPPCVV